MPAQGPFPHDAETRHAHDTRYRDLVMAALPKEYRQELSSQARWLYRTLRSAELAGLDPAEVALSANSTRLAELDAKNREGGLPETEFYEWQDLRDKGLVRRDIKPHNVILTRTGA